MSSTDTPIIATDPVRHKSIASLAGLLAGIFGLHRLYLRRPLWWLYPALAMPLIGHALRQPEYYREWSFYGFGLVFSVAMLETITICLMPLDKFNERYNAGAAGQSKGGTLPVIVAMLALVIGTVMLMSALSLMMEEIFTPGGV